MMSEAVTVPPGLLIRITSARIPASSEAFLSSSRNRTRSPTRGVDVPTTTTGDGPSSLRNPEMSVRRIFGPLVPSTVCSSSDRILGVRSIEMSEQPPSSESTKSTVSRVDMARVYREG